MPQKGKSSACALGILSHTPDNLTMAQPASNFATPFLADATKGASLFGDGASYDASIAPAVLQGCHWQVMGDGSGTGQSRIGKAGG